MDISVIIVSWNVKEKLKENLRALYNSNGDFSFEVFVVDNNSFDGSRDMIAREFPQVKLIINTENKGFAKACNQGIARATGDFILLLNPDNKVFNDTLFNMFSWMKKNSQATVAGCKLIDEKGLIVRQVRRFPQLKDQLAIILKLPHFFPKIINKYLMANFDYNQEAKVDSIRGSFFMINKLNYQKIGGGDYPFLDERYFIWFEEVDFCRHVFSLGGEVWYTPVTRCFDYVGSSFSQLKRGVTQLYFRASMLKYFYKWQPFYEYLILWFFWSPIFLITKICYQKSR